MSDSVVYLNGEFLPRSEARLSVDDRGFFFGDGVYEVTRAVDGKLFESGRHMKRLARGLRELRLEPTQSLDEIETLSLELLGHNDITAGEGTVYLQITRGAAPRTHHFPPAGTPCTVFLSAQRFTVPHDKRAAGVAVITYPDIRWSRCDIKTVNLLAAVMAKQQAVDEGVFEALFVRESAVTEGSHTNVFGLIDGELRTYPASNLILGGVTRDVVLELARELGLPVSETPFHIHHVKDLQECFLTGTTTDVMPVVQFDGAPVGTGKPGKVTMILYEALAARLYGAVAAGSR
ncbi:MAG: D-amino acid aminotransferase [Gemmatimonadaceae bacterium]|nr:D-amino acid aminotransferase [Gemmatimonadaceae bacterium]